MKKTSQRSLLFRQNVGRTEEEWAHFLDGYRQALSLRLDLGRGGREGDEGLARTRGGYLHRARLNRGKMRSAPGPVPSDFRLDVFSLCGIIPKIAASGVAIRAWSCRSAS